MYGCATSPSVAQRYATWRQTGSSMEWDCRESAGQDDLATWSGVPKKRAPYQPAQTMCFFCHHSTGYRAVELDR
jgi:hypothetical protein